MHDLPPSRDGGDQHATLEVMPYHSQDVGAREAEGVLDRSLRYPKVTQRKSCSEGLGKKQRERDRKR